MHPYPIPPLYPPQYMHPYMFGNGFPFPSTAQRFPEFNNREGGFSNLVMNNYVCKNSNTNRELNKSLRGANKKRFQH